MTEIFFGIVSMVAVLVGHLLQKQREFKVKLAEKKRAAYEKLFENFIKKVNKLNPEEKKDKIELDEQEMTVMSQLLLFVPDKEIRLYIKWIREIEKNFEKKDNLKEKELSPSQKEFGELLKSIRKDILGKKTKLTHGEVNALLPMCGKIEELIEREKTYTKIADNLHFREDDN
jgi:hypothetical protein